MEEEILAEGRLKSSAPAGAYNGKAGYASEEEIPRNRHSRGEGRSHSRRDSRSPSPDRHRYRDQRQERKRYSRSRSPERDRYEVLSLMEVPMRGDCASSMQPQSEINEP